MSLTYAIPDLHGRLDLLDAALEQIASHAGATSYRVVTLGDYVDRGPNGRGVVERLMGLAASGFPVTCLRGNHEDMMTEGLAGRYPLRQWLRYGGAATLLSYGHPAEGDFTPGVVPGEHVAWLRALPVIHTDGLRVFVHADIDTTLPIAEQDEGHLMWGRRHRDESVDYAPGYVVHGHTPFEDGPVVMAGRCNLDTRAWWNGRLCIAVFHERAPGGPIEIVEVVGEPDPGYIAASLDP